MTNSAIMGYGSGTWNRESLFFKVLTFCLLIDLCFMECWFQPWYYEPLYMCRGSGKGLFWETLVFLSIYNSIIFNAYVHKFHTYKEIYLYGIHMTSPMQACRYLHINILHVPQFCSNKLMRTWGTGNRYIYLTTYIFSDNVPTNT